MKDEKAPFGPSDCSPRTRSAAKRRPGVGQAPVRRAKATLAELEAERGKAIDARDVAGYYEDFDAWKEHNKKVGALSEAITAKRREESRAANARAMPPGAIEKPLK